MPGRNPDISGSSVVLLGAFNPRIFQPQWFAREGLLSQEQADAADVKVIIPQVSHFETEQFVMQVSEDRFAVASKTNADPAPLCDLVRGTFFILEHTPVSAMGLNRQMHFALGSEEAWHQLGDRLAPKDGWKGVLGGRPGMRALLIETDEASESVKKFTVRVEPSVQVRLGVFFETNEHYQAPEEDSLKRLMETLNARWEEVPIYASRVVEHILDWAAANK